MSITMDNTTLKKIYYDGTEVKKAYYDGVLVFSGWDGSIMNNPDFNGKWTVVGIGTNKYGLVIRDSYMKLYSYDSDIYDDSIKDPDLKDNDGTNHDPTDDDEVWGTQVYAYLPVDVTDCKTLNIYGAAINIGPYYCASDIWVSSTIPTDKDLGTRIVWNSHADGLPPKEGWVNIDVSGLTGIYYICMTKIHWQGYTYITQMYFDML